MDLTASIKSIILELNSGRTHPKPPVYLSIPPVVSSILRQERNLEKLIKKFLEHVMLNSLPTRSIRVSVHEKTGMTDLEKFFSASPSYWFRVNIQSQARAGFEKGARELLEELGYHCIEWMGVEDSYSQLGAFSYGEQNDLALVLFIQNHRACRICDFLIPVNESAPFFAHAI